jgi:hypothetical protein
MTPTERQDLVSRLRSLADGIEGGKAIQTRGTDCWRDQGEEYFQAWLINVQCVRVKPEPLECWVNMYGSSLTVHHSPELAKEHGRRAARVAVHMREVTE